MKCEQVLVFVLLFSENYHGHLHQLLTSRVNQHGNAAFAI